MDFELLRLSSQSRFLELLTMISPASVPKDIVIYGSLMKPLDQVAGARLMRETGIDKMFKLEKSTPVWRNNTRIYFIPSTLSAAEQVVKHLLISKDGSSASVKYHIIIFPKTLSLIQSLFESNGILDLATLHNFCWDFIPLDKDLLSLELGDFFGASFLQGDNSYFGVIAKILMSFECHYGKFGSLVTLGERSFKIHKLLTTWQNEFQPSYPPNSEFSHLFIIDRSVDFASILLTQLTYEGFLDENFRIEAGFTYVKENEGLQRLMLNSTKDDVYAEIRGKHISAVFQYLSIKAKQLQILRDKKNTESLEEMKNFISNELKVVQLQQKFLAIHISACEQIMKKQEGIMEELLSLQHDVMADSRSKEYLTFLEDAMARQFDFVIVLRLLCLYCLMQDGIPEKELIHLQKSFLQAYGYKYLPVLHRLQRLNLFYQRETKLSSLEPLSEKFARVAVSSISQPSQKISFKRICQLLNLLAISTDLAETIGSMKDSQHPSYVYGGIYTPVVYRVVEKFLKSNEPLDGELTRSFGTALRASNPNGSVLQQGKVLVFFLGGVTLAEVATLRLLGQQTGRSIAIASTSTISGTSFVEALLD